MSTEHNDQVSTVTSTTPTGCKITGCTKDMKNCSHGVCRTHYKMLLKQVRAGDTTWKALEDMGMCDPASYTRDPHDRDILEAMQREMIAKAQQ
jgi:hypothetical protein